MPHLCIDLPEVGMEGEELRSSQGTAVPVSWADTQKTFRVRMIKYIPVRPLDATHWVHARRGLSAGIGRGVSLCPQVGPVLGEGNVARFIFKNNNALMCRFHCICVKFHVDSPRLDMARRRSFLGRLWWVDRLRAVANRQEHFPLIGECLCLFASNIRWGSGDVYCVEPHQVGPHLHQQVVSLLWHLWKPLRRRTLMIKTAWLDVECNSSFYPA